MLKILRAGLQSSVQDAGRLGFRRIGVSRAGALDLPALRIANLLVGNSQGEAALEVVLGQFTLQFEKETWFALTGAGAHAKLDGEPVWTGWRKRARAGQRLTLDLPARGMRSYLAVAGGIAVPEIMESKSTDFGAGFGGFEGRKLISGDRLPVGKPGRDFSHSVGVRQLLWGNRIRAIPGPEYHQFAQSSRNSFWHQPWHLSRDSNRSGYGLRGQPLIYKHRPDSHYHGVLPGVIQVPHSGLPTVLMNDAQSLGCYPRIASIIEADRYHLAQMRLGEPIHFVTCSVEEALEADNEQQSYFAKLAWQLERD